MKTLKKITLSVAVIGAIVVNFIILPIETKALPEAHCAMLDGAKCYLGMSNGVEVWVDDWYNK